MTDYHSHDETLAGRVTQASLVGVLVSLPDYVESRFSRFLVSTILTVGGGALNSALHSGGKDVTTNVTIQLDQLKQAIGDIGNAAGPQSDIPAGDPISDSPVKTGSALMAAAIMLLVLVRAEGLIQRRLAAAMRQRGVKLPYTVLGAISAGATFVVAQDADRRRSAA
ncbi:hypothetical protein [Corynebacterium alimapuense]|uniref:Uncharacterized protein n=1 Tax=Corynebacterium alimapuense TaxID=1576874 RepID=A0A3M8K6S9_9CORY|nr:hypothetical protein [Corynebacterium alimapuense]RNE48218.1 hypothetical protein C5L39_10160 [Corynebacterium alimapuense]